MTGCAHPETSSGRCTTCGAFAEAGQVADISGWLENHLGQMPPICAGKRVHVELRNGMKPRESWPAGGEGVRGGCGGCDWSLTGGAFDIVRFRIVG